MTSIGQLAAKAAFATAVVSASLMVAAGTAAADDPWPWPNPPGPGIPGPGLLPPPGHIGQITGVPPGQWGKGAGYIPFCDDLNPGCVNHI